MRITIIEYKRHSNENVINQGLFYLDWLHDHQAEFQLLVMKKLEKEVTESIEWNGTRLICIAADFNRYDEHAVQQINRNIELMRYRYFGNDLLLLELVNAQTAESSPSKVNAAKPVTSKSGAVANSKSKSADKSQEDRLAEASPELINLFNKVCDYANGLGDEVQQKDPRLLLLLKLNPDDIELESNFSRDVREIGHWGTGNLELSVRNESELEKALALILKSYQAN